MSDSLELFSCWKRVQQHPHLPVFHKRVLFASPDLARTVIAVLSLVGDQSRLTVTLEEPDNKPLVIVTKGSEGVSSLARATTWAEWVISDYEAMQQPAKRSKRGSVKVSTRKISEAA